MYARVTEVKIDTTAATVDEVLNRFRAAVLPSLREQPGYKGIVVLGAPDGRGMLVSLWATEQAASEMKEGGWYFQTLTDFATIVRATPGSSSYEVLEADLPPGSPSSW